MALQAVPFRVTGGPVSPRGGVVFGLPFERGRSVGQVRPPTRSITRNILGGSGGGVKRNEGVEDTDDADMEELLARSRERLIVDVRPLPEWRSKTEAAMRNGREMLCRELCLHLGVTPRELGAIWRGGGLEDKVRIFLREWGWMHRPLSLGATVEMLDEHMASLYGRNSGARAASTPSRPLHLLLRVFGGDPLKG